MYGRDYIFRRILQRLWKKSAQKTQSDFLLHRAIGKFHFWNNLNIELKFSLLYMNIERKRININCRRTERCSFASSTCNQKINSVPIVCQKTPSFSRWTLAAKTYANKTVTWEDCFTVILSWTANSMKEQSKTKLDTIWIRTRNGSGRIS